MIEHFQASGGAVFGPFPDGSEDSPQDGAVSWVESKYVIFQAPIDFPPVDSSGRVDAMGGTTWDIRSRSSDPTTKSSDQAKTDGFARVQDKPLIC